MIIQGDCLIELKKLFTYGIMSDYKKNDTPKKQGA